MSRWKKSFDIALMVASALSCPERSRHGRRHEPARRRPRLVAREADLPEHVEEMVQLWIEERLATRHQRGGHLPLGVGPGDDVGEAEVAERVLRVGSVGAEPAPTQHEAHAVAEREPEGQVELEIGLLGGGAPDRPRVEDADAVDLPAVEEELVEEAQL